MTSLNSVGHRPYSNDFQAWMDRVDSLCGRYHAHHEGNDLKWLIEEPSHLNAPNCMRMINNCRHMYRTQEDSRIDQHDFYFLVLQLNGKSVMSQGDETSTLSPGDLILVDSTRGSNFHFGIDGTISDQLSLIIDRERLQRTFKSDKISTGKTILSSAFSASMISHLVQDIFFRPAPSILHQDAALESALCLLRPDFTTPTLSPTDSIKASSDKLLKKAARIIETHLDNPELTPTSVAAQMGTSVRNLHRVFARHLLTPGKYIIEERLTLCAQRLKQDSDAQISNIAMDCGFVDLSHFSKLFKARFGVTAREFRDRNGA